MNRALIPGFLLLIAGAVHGLEEAVRLQLKDGRTIEGIWDRSTGLFSLRDAMGTATASAKLVIKEADVVRSEPLDLVLRKGRWVSPAEVKRLEAADKEKEFEEQQARKGLVKVDGSWVTREESERRDAAARAVVTKAEAAVIESLRSSSSTEPAKESAPVPVTTWINGLPLTKTPMVDIKTLVPALDKTVPAWTAFWKGSNLPYGAQQQAIEDTTKALGYGAAHFTTRVAEMVHECEAGGIKYLPIAIDTADFMLYEQIRFDDKRWSRHRGPVFFKTPCCVFMNVNLTARGTDGQTKSYRISTPTAGWSALNNLPGGFILQPAESRPTEPQWAEVEGQTFVVDSAEFAIARLTPPESLPTLTEAVANWSNATKP